MTAHSALEVFEKLKAAINEALQNEGFNEVFASSGGIEN